MNPFIMALGLTFATICIVGIFAKSFEIFDKETTVEEWEEFQEAFKKGNK